MPDGNSRAEPEQEGREYGKTDAEQASFLAQLMVKLLLTENGLPLNAGTCTPRKRAGDAGAGGRALEGRAGDRGRLRAAARREDDRRRAPFP